MDFDKITTDELETLFPPNENDNWEFKDAAYLLKDKRQELSKELATQASAFANTGGGFLVLGYADKSKTPQPCEEQVGNEPMQDWLSKRIHQSVEYPLQAFRVHRIPITADPSKAVFVIVFEDSPHAPHQSKVDKKYYWRIGSSSEPAPHFHLELLRNRLTRTVLQIERVRFEGYPTEFKVSLTPRDPESTVYSVIRVDLHVEVQNTSMSASHSWGVYYTPHDMGNWCHVTTRVFLFSGGCERPSSGTLLPGEAAYVTLPIYCRIVTNAPNDHEQEIIEAFSDLSLTLRPVSHDHIGESVHWGRNDEDISDKHEQLIREFIHEMRSRGYPIAPEESMLLPDGE